MAVLAVFRPASLDPLGNFVYDTVLRQARTGPPGGRVVIVDIDERTLATKGQLPWPRELVGRLVSRLDELGPALVALDMVFPEPERSGRDELTDALSLPSGPSPGDLALAEAIRRRGAAVGYAMNFDDARRLPHGCDLRPLGLALIETPGSGASAPLSRAGSATCNLPVLGQAAGALGFLNVTPDSDGVLRRLPLLIELDGRRYPSLPLVAVNVVTGVQDVALEIVNVNASRLKLDDRRPIPLDGKGNLLVRFRGRRNTLSFVSAADVLDRRVAPDAVRDKIVFVGTTGLGLRESVSTPVDAQLTGVELLATVADNLLEEEFVGRHADGRFFEAAATLAIGMGIVALVARTTLGWGVVAGGVTVAFLWLAAVWGVSAVGVFISPLYPTLSVAVGLVGLSHARFRVERERLVDASRALEEAKNDGLTGVGNRGAFDEFFGDQFERATANSPLSLFFADVDHFKRFNDVHGHGLGDRVLVEFARALQAGAPDSRHVFRIGGEEFAIVCPGLPAEGATRFAERVLRIVRNEAQVVDEQGGVLQIRCSIGIATHNGRRFRRKEQLMQSADRGLYAAKAAGRDCARRTDAPSSPASNRPRTEAGDIQSSDESR